jgi:hypothetical protein
MLIAALDPSDFGDLSFALRRTLHHRATAEDPCRSVSWAPISVVASDRYAYEWKRTYTEQYHDEKPHHKVQEWKTRRVAEIDPISFGGGAHPTLDELHEKYSFPAHV